MNYLIIGSSYKLIDKEIIKIVKGSKYKTYSLTDTALDEILVDASYGSLFDEEKIIVIKNFEASFDNKKDELEALNNYLDGESNTTMIFVSNANIPANTKLNKGIISKLKVIQTKIVTKPYEVSALICELTREYGFKIGESEASIFALKCAYNIDIAIMELEKLKLIKEKNTTITENDIEELIPNYNVNDAFELKDAIVNRNVEKAVTLIDQAENSKMELLPLVVMLAKEYELLYTISVLTKERKTNDQIGAMLDNMHPYRVKMLKSTANKYTIDKLKYLLAYLCHLDLKCVSEDNLGFVELKKFLLEL